MATMQRRIGNVLDTNPATKDLTKAQKQEVVEEVDAVIPSTPVYIWIVAGIIIALAASIGGVLAIALRNIDNEIVVTGFIALATTSIGALAGALIPSRS